MWKKSLKTIANLVKKIQQIDQKFRKNVEKTMNVGVKLFKILENRVNISQKVQKIDQKTRKNVENNWKLGIIWPKKGTN